MAEHAHSGTSDSPALVCLCSSCERILDLESELARLRAVDDAMVEKALNAAFAAKGRELSYTEEGWLRAALRAALNSEEQG